MEFNSLPPEIHLVIFSYLSIREVMKIRLVCKQWNRLINGEFKFKRMRCLQPPRYCPDNSADFYFTSIRPFLDYTSADMKFSRVQCLSVDLWSKFAELQDAFDLLNSFRSLEDVQFSYYVSWELFAPRPTERKQFVVALHHLKNARFYFSFNQLRQSTISIVLNLPSLNSFSFGSSGGLQNLTIEHPEKLRVLKIDDLLRNAFDYSRFTNLTEIYTSVSNLRTISASFIERLPSLKELHLGDHYDPNRSPPPPSPGKTAPRIFYFGFEISLRQINLDDQQWPLSFLLNQETARFISRNLHQSIDNNPYVLGIEYNAVARELNDRELFSAMPQKFPMIDSLRIVGNLADEKRLLKFIGQFKIKALGLERTSLSQWFFGQLTEHCSFIRKLRIRLQRTMCILSGDLDFIFKFKKLSSLEIRNCSLPANFLGRLLRETKVSWICFEQPGIYRLTMGLTGDMLTTYVYVIYFRTNLGSLGSSRKFSSSEDLREFVNLLSSRSKADGYVCPQELQLLIRQLDVEEQNALFMIRRYVYEQRHTIYLPLKQMSLLNGPI